MKALGYVCAFLSGALAGAALGVLVAPEKGKDTQKKLVDTVTDFCKKHNLKLTRKDVDALVDDIQDATNDEE
ncbi:MAG: YtxH domain-containing protein [Prevotella sp.]|nr:YtxH domain-containing protein [Prevotella sp.]